MQAIRVHNYGGTDVLELEQVPRPEPQVGEVLIRVQAAGINPVDWKIRQGWMKDVRPMTFPYIPGADLAGVVEELGPSVTAFQKGQAVFGQTTKGAYAEYTTASVQTLALKPRTLDFDNAAAIPIPATTAWQGLFDHGKLQAGKRVLIQGAAGGVGHFAVQFAKWISAHVIGTTSTANVDFVSSLGAEKVIDYTSESVESVVHDVDLVLDTVGSKTLDTSLQILRRGGILVTIAGLPSLEKAQEHGVQVASFAARVSSELLQTLAQLIEEEQVKVVVTEKFPLSEVRQAHELSERGHGHGRMVLHIAD